MAPDLIEPALHLIRPIRPCSASNERLPAAWPFIIAAQRWWGSAVSSLAQLSVPDPGQNLTPAAPDPPPTTETEREQRKVAEETGPARVIGGGRRWRDAKRLHHSLRVQ